MPLDLPKPIAEYFAADQARDAHALARCFAVDGVVHDEGGTFRGTEAIRDWSAATREKYHHTVEPLSASERDGATIVAGGGAGGVFRRPGGAGPAFPVGGGKNGCPPSSSPLFLSRVESIEKKN